MRNVGDATRSSGSAACWRTKPRARHVLPLPSGLRDAGGSGRAYDVGRSRGGAHPRSNTRAGALRKTVPSSAPRALVCAAVGRATRRARPDAPRIRRGQTYPITLSPQPRPYLVSRLAPSPLFGLRDRSLLLHMGKGSQVRRSAAVPAAGAGRRGRASAARGAAQRFALALLPKSSTRTRGRDAPRRAAATHRDWSGGRRTVSAFRWTRTPAIAPRRTARCADSPAPAPAAAAGADDAPPARRSPARRLRNTTPRPTCGSSSTTACTMCRAGASCTRAG